MTPGEINMYLLRTMGVMWTLFSPGSRHGRFFTAETLMEVSGRDGLKFKSRAAADRFIRWVLREQVVELTESGYRFTDDVRDVYWFYMDSEGMPPEDAQLSPDARARADAIAARVVARRQQVAAASKASPPNGVPHGLTKLTGVSADPRWRKAIIAALYRVFGESYIDRKRCFGLLREEFGWGDQVPGNAIGRVLYGLDHDDLAQSLMIRFDDGYYSLTQAGIAFAKEE